MATYPIKMLRDEEGKPFVPLISLDSIQDGEGNSFGEALENKLEADNLKAGSQIELTVEDGNVIISSSAEGAKLINDLTIETSGVGALDAAQGKVLKDSIPEVVNNLNTIDSTKALSAHQGYVLAGRVAPVGGATGQVLKKASDSDYSFEWGDAADPNAIVGDGSIMKIVELSYKEYLDLESNGQLQDDTEYHISDWNEARSTSIAYDIGDVYITSTPENPQERLGGTWELIDKGFRVEQFAYSGEDISNFVTIENNSVDISQFVVRRIGHNVDIRIEMSTLIALADTAVDLMTINVNALGIKGFSYTKYGQLIGSDGGNGFVNLTIYDYGKVTSVDVLVRGDAPGTLPAGSSPRFYYSQEVTASNMLDDYCNQFYWKRTA